MKGSAVKIEIGRRVGFYEVDSGFSLRFKSLLHFFQDSTIIHSDLGGCGIRWLMEQGNAWILHRFCVQVDRMPVLGDELRIFTWSRGRNGFRAYRDFEIFCNQEKLVSATSLWLFIDLDRKRLLKIPEEADQWYPTVDENALGTDIDAFHPNLRFDPDISETIHIRPSDIDPLGHVNNAVYLELLENLIHGVFQNKKKIQTVVIQFHNEISEQVDRVDIGIQPRNDLYEFKLFSPGCIHAAGTFTVA